MAGKSKITKQKFILQHKEFIGPNFIRLYLGRENIEEYLSMTCGSSCKLYFPPLEMCDKHFAKYNEKSGKWISASEKFKPKSRTYTLRKILPKNNQLVIDVANHGTQGPGTRWANLAKVGDAIGVTMKNCSKKIAQKADWYCLAADLTGLPVVSVIAENLPSTAKGVMLIEVPSKEDIHAIDTPLDIHWVVNPLVGANSDLYKKLKKIEFPTKKKINRFAYVASESTSTKKIRTFFKENLAWKRHEYFCTSHWKSGKEERNAIEKCYKKTESIELISL
ncbi:siderophore-interacting protein [Weeksella virosa]|uniref:siderophore-interacting protein n=1 Tax=Weeksella virosa TaxID=1014 RepID=UPI002554F28F|nr:siderophore-interacting protein [Weeksella virosa]MDK7674452.1 siderophore-interacting protein [Weeksella virosa]